MPGSRNAGDAFAAALAAGDLDGDGADDLAVGIPGEKSKRGAVSVVYSAGSAGLTGARTDYWTQDSDRRRRRQPPPATGSAPRWPWAGSNSGSTEDLAIGVPADTVGVVKGAGAVQRPARLVRGPHLGRLPVAAPGRHRGQRQDGHRRQVRATP